MSYSNLLKDFIKKSKLTLDEISDEVGKRGLSISREHLSRLQNGKTPPASDELNRILAEVTGGDAQALILAGHIEKAPEEVKNTFAEAQKYKKLYQEIISALAGKDYDIENFESDPSEYIFELLSSSINTDLQHKEIFATVAFLIEYIENHRSGKNIDEDLYRRINGMLATLRIDYDFDVPLGGLRNFPEYAVEIIARIKSQFYPEDDSIRLTHHIINFNDYVDDKGNPIFHLSPYPEITDRNSSLIEEEKVFYLNQDKIFPEQQKSSKYIFFEELEKELNIDLTDPKIQKQLKRAAKIFFADEE